MEERYMTTEAISSIVMIAVIFIVFYFLLIRPENKKKKQTTEMRNSLKVGDKITTIGGIQGTICHIKDETLVIETGADRVRIEFTRWAISSNDSAPKPEGKKK